MKIHLTAYGNYRNTVDGKCRPYCNDNKLLPAKHLTQRISEVTCKSCLKFRKSYLRGIGLSGPELNELKEINKRLKEIE